MQKSSLEKVNQPHRHQLEHNYDLAIIGSGISCAYTLINYISLLQAKLSSREDRDSLTQVRVAVFDKSGEFWTGIPYGSRTGKQSLIITSLAEFLPQPERDRFVNWLKDNYTSIFHTLEQRPGTLNEKWLKSYEEAMLEGDWDRLFIPRYIFGWYVKERVEHLLKDAANQGYLQCDLFSADVSNIQSNAATYQVEFTTSNSDYACLIAKKVVLAIGSPPNKLPFVEQFATNQESNITNDICFIGNMYEPGQDDSLRQIFQFLRQSKADASQLNQVVIIGSNASALETIYSLDNDLESQELIDKFIVISPNGSFPHRIYDDPVSTSFIPQNLKRLIQSNTFTAEQILEAVKLDVSFALEQGETVNSTYPLISTEVINALNKLSFAEQKLFVIKYGVEIGKFQRRAGQDYLNVVDRLNATGRLKCIKGKFTKTIPLSLNKIGFEFIDPTQQIVQFTEPVKVIINCAGFQNVTKSSSPLIDNLIRQEICTPNDSLCGFEMNEDFAAHENLYLMGPLVAGNINSKLKIWHAESCGRIINLSQQLAQVLI